MKPTTILTLVAVGITTTAAAPAPAPAPEADPRWCTWIGQSCWKVKRTAAAFAEALASSGSPSTSGGAPSVEARYSNQPGGAAFKAKRALDGLAGVVAATRDTPLEYYNALGLDLHFVPDEPLNVTHGPGNSGHAKREADARWCTWIGQSCWKARRAAEAVVNTIDGFDKEKRDNVAFEPLAFGKRAAAPEADPRWCTWIGQSCWKRDNVVGVEARCNAPDGECTKAKRDLLAMYHAARSVLDEIPAGEKA